MAKKPTDELSQEVRKSQRRQKIVEAAAPLFASLSYSACEMDRVATDAHVAKGTLYLYFPNKQELFHACVDFGISQMHQTVKAAADVATDPIERIARAIHAYLVFFDQHPYVVELLMQERAIFKDRQRPTYFEYRDANRGPWRDMYVGLVQAGRLRADLPVERMMDTVGNLLYGTIFTNHFIGRSVSLEEQYTTILEIVFRGMMTDQERVGGM
jgi:AcrR family transcriptional regulator